MNVLTVQWCVLFIYLFMFVITFGEVKMLQYSTLRVVTDIKLDLVGTLRGQMFFFLWIIKINNCIYFKFSLNIHHIIIK